jgi:N-acetylglucosaminyldiphosphoundecaprenol N-acetyl-beta-D-mannosaminyltransferase
MIVLGVRIDNLHIAEARQKIRDFLEHDGQQAVFTPNPEMLVDAFHNPYFRTILNWSGLNICDGRGVELVTRGKLERIPGIDFVEDICAVAAKKQKTVYLLGSGKKDVIEGSAKVLMSHHPGLSIVGTHPGILISLVRDAERGMDIKYSQDENNDLLADIITAAPSILFVAFGHVKQEEWIAENLKHLPSVQIAVGVGGAFDMISGSLRRAPRLFRFLGLEWLWRLMIQPYRYKRIWKATIQFLYLYYRYG